MSRERQRTSVDLPDPDRPMTISVSAAADLQGDVVDRGDHAVALEDGGFHHALAVGAQIRRVETEDLVQRTTANDGLGHGSLPALTAGGLP